MAFVLSITVSLLSIIGLILTFEVNSKVLPFLLGSTFILSILSSLAILFMSLLI